MALVKPFVMDGVAYNVIVKELTRKFSVLDTNKTGRTQDGSMYRDPIGTFYNYALVIDGKLSDRDAYDALWDALSQPVKSHVCVFPYNQTTLSQRMYVTSGEQKINLLHECGADWGQITVNFIAMEPRVVA